MSLLIGSARVNENGTTTGGAAGDQTGGEVATQAYYQHKKGWWKISPKSMDVANKLAAAMLEACNNNNIGYCQTHRTGALTQLKKAGSLAKISTKTEADCSALVRACIYQATGKDVGNFTTANEKTVLAKSGLFEDAVAVTSKTELHNGDVLVTRSKGHTAIVVSGNPRQTAQATTSTTTTSASSSKVDAAQKMDKSLAGIYKTTANLHLRSGAGTSKTSLAILPAGTTVNNYGYYTEVSGVKWLYVAASVGGKQLTGFCTSQYLRN